MTVVMQQAPYMGDMAKSMEAPEEKLNGLVGSLYYEDGEAKMTASAFHALPGEKA